MTKDINDFKKLRKIESGQKNLFSVGPTLTDSSQILRGKMNEMLNAKATPPDNGEAFPYITEEEEGYSYKEESIR